jgi:transcriptional regulator with XRE-family HTH domain
MHPDTDVQEVFRLAELGLTQTAIAGQTGVGQSTVSRWLRLGEAAIRGSPMRAAAVTNCPADCRVRTAAPDEAYAYLLGQYLGDGSIVHTRRGVYRLFITCCAAYPGILEESRLAIRSVLPLNTVGQRSKSGCIDLWCYSKHLPCLFPQHGPGKKHTRAIKLEPWQEAIALDAHPDRFVRGLIHSDGWRGTNRVRGANGQPYAYPRYQFSNKSSDIRELFGVACDRLGVKWRQMNRVNISVARRESVVLLDTFVGPKS